jgi:putative nucleotidyltransferase with HDIG domain
MIAAAVVERLARRTLPLAIMLQLSLVFPDHAPSRFALARRAGNPRVLKDRIQVAREKGIDDDPSRAAEEIISLVGALSAHDRKTRGHSERVRAFTDLIAEELKLSEADRDRLRWAALLHDIGKLRVPTRILNKPGKPDPHEWAVLEGHPEAGAILAAPLLPWLGEWASTIAQHHERYDGKGYPNRLAGDSISLGARIVSVADSFEVMTAARSYKKPMSVPAARAELARCVDAQFDAVVVRAFFSISLGRLWWKVGPAAWVAVTPLLGWLQRTAGQAAIAARSAAILVVLGAGGALPGHSIVAASAAPARSTAGETTGLVDGGNLHGGGPAAPGKYSPGGSGSGGSDGSGSTGSGDAGGSGSSGGGGTSPVPSPVGNVVGSIGKPVGQIVKQVGGVVAPAVDTVGTVVSGTAGTVVDDVTNVVKSLPGLPKL